MPYAPSFGVHVLKIRLPRPKEEMDRVDTGRVVTPMQNAQFSRIANEKSVGNARRPKAFRVGADLPVAVLIFPAFPEDAATFCLLPAVKQEAVDEGGFPTSAPFAPMTLIGFSNLDKDGQAAFGAEPFYFQISVVLAASARTELPALSFTATKQAEVSSALLAKTVDPGRLAEYDRTSVTGLACRNAVVSTHGGSFILGKFAALGQTGRQSSIVYMTPISPEKDADAGA